MYQKVYDFLAMEQMYRLQKKRAVAFENGWVFSLKFRHFQKVNKQLYVYVTPQAFGLWMVQAYLKGTANYCSLEARVEDPREVWKLFHLGETWLNEYAEHPERMKDDPYNPFYSKGWKGEKL